jgi:hypothetical protein
MYAFLLAAFVTSAACSSAAVFRAAGSSASSSRVAGAVASGAATATSSATTPGDDATTPSDDDYPTFVPAFSANTSYLQTIGGAINVRVSGLVYFSLSQQATAYRIGWPRGGVISVVSLYGKTNMECAVDAKGDCLSYCPLAGACVTAKMFEADERADMSGPFPPSPLPPLH